MLGFGTRALDGFGSSSSLIDDQIGVGIDDHHLIFRDHVARTIGSDDRRQPQAARQDRRMRGRTAEFSHESGEFEIGAILQVQHVGRRQVARNQYESLAGGELLRQRHARGPAFGQRIQDTLDDLANIGRAFAQILVVDRLELPGPSRAES